jgi:tight adherence protein C
VIGAGALAVAAAVCLAAAVVDGLATIRGRRPASRRRTRREDEWLARLAGVGRRVGSWAPSRGLDERLCAAGLAPRLRAVDVMAAKVGAAVLAPLIAAPVALMLPGRLAAAAATAFASGGFLTPDLWLRRRARLRAQAMSRELPDVVDLLRVGVAAGLSAPRALAEVGRRRGGVLGGELCAVAAHIELGVSPWEAIASLPSRCPVDGMAALVAALQRADRHGAPLSSALGALAARARADRARRLREEAARAAPKMQLVVALLLAPAVMLAVGAALVVTLLD